MMHGPGFLPLLASPPTVHPWNLRKVAFVSGLSDPSTCALSQDQVRFLRALPMDDASRVEWNFPFVPCPKRPFRAPPLWRASWHNVRQFRQASSDAYRRAGRRHWRALTASCAELTVVTLSCGLEIVNQLHEADDAAARVHIIALGPVAHRRPSASHCLIQGRLDWISRFYFRTAEVILPGIGHMTYLSRPEVFEQVKKQLWTNSST